MGKERFPPRCRRSRYVLTRNPVLRGFLCVLVSWWRASRRGQGTVHPEKKLKKEVDKKDFSVRIQLPLCHRDERPLKSARKGRKPGQKGRESRRTRERFLLTPGL